MSFANDLFQPPAESFSSGDQRETWALRNRLTALAFLVLAGLAIRAAMALNWDILWGDTIVYLRACDALEKGDFERAFAGLGMNTYPAILLVMRCLGLDCTVAAVWWSVLVSSLVVLPLFGWVRRQFDDRVALLACVLYVLHPKLLAFSPLTIRDPTFWFLFTLTLYLLWRAVTELRWWMFASGGVALILACLTRTEGWLLLVPLLLWPAGRFLAAGGKDRLRLAGGTALSLAMIPLLLAAVNLTLLQNHPRWEFGYNRCMAHAVKLVGKLDHRADTKAAAIGQESQSTVTPETVTKIEPRHGFPIWDVLELARKVVGRLFKAFTYAYCPLAVIGLWCWRRVFFRPEHQAIFTMNVLLMVAIGVRHSLDGIDIRYYLPIVIVSTPFMALGLLQAVQWVGRRDATKTSRPVAVGVGLLGIIAVVGSFSVMPSSRAAMYEHAELGMWILEQFGPRQKIVGSYEKQSLIEYYARGQLLSCPNFREYTAEPLLPLLHKGTPDVVLLWRSWRHDDDWQPYREKILDRQEELGYHEIPPDRLPASCKNVKVLLRNDKRLK